MSELDQLSMSIAEKVADYREGEIEPIGEGNVRKWSRQFDESSQLGLLQEMDYVLGRTYISQGTARDFYADLATNEALTKGQHRGFWQNSTFLEIQRRGQSQTELLSLFDQELEKACGLSTNICSGQGLHVYIDDAIFSGNHVISDLEKWIRESAPSETRLVIVAFITHLMAEQYIRKRLGQVAKNANKKINIEIWKSQGFENRPESRSRASVLWPARLPLDKDVKEYVASVTDYPFMPRSLGWPSNIDVFSSEDGRQLLEREMLIAGVKIRDWYGDLEEYWKPLGFGNFGLGFGSMTVTFRNCPNNCPLALWWGDHGTNWKPSSVWYPLFPRKPNAKPKRPRSLTANASLTEPTYDFDDIPF